jgi:hypothetical protein
MASPQASPASLAATAAEEKQPHVEESKDDEEAESEKRAASSSQPQQADDDDDDGTSFTTLLFSDRGTRLPYWTVETRRELQREPERTRAAANVEARMSTYRQGAAGDL